MMMKSAILMGTILMSTSASATNRYIYCDVSGNISNQQKIEACLNLTTDIEAKQISKTKLQNLKAARGPYELIDSSIKVVNMQNANLRFSITHVSSSGVIKERNFGPNTLFIMDSSGIHIIFKQVARIITKELGNK